MIHKVKYPEDQGGVWKFWFVPKNEVANISDVINGIVNSVSLRENCFWREVEFAPQSGKLQISEKDGTDGSVWQTTFTAFIPGDSLAFATLLTEMDQHRFVLIAKDFQSRMRLLGVDVALTYSNDFNSGEKVEDRKGYVLKFTAELPENPPFLFTQDLVDEFNACNEEKEIVPHVTPGQTGAVGPAPVHRWNGTALQFQNPDFSWGISVDLRGQVPAHRWVGTGLQFQNTDGSWGVVVDLKGVPGNDADVDISDMATQTWVTEKGYATEQWVQNQNYLTQHQSLNGYATEQWVTGKNYLTQHQDLSAYAKTNDVWTKTGVPNLNKLIIDANGNLLVPGNVISYADPNGDYGSIFDNLPLATTSSKGIAQFSNTYFTVVDGIVSVKVNSVGLNEMELANYLTANNYATQQWVQNQNYLTQHQSLNGYATEQWVTGKNYLTQHQDLSAYAKTNDVWTKTGVPNLNKLTIDANGNLLVPGNVISYADMDEDYGTILDHLPTASTTSKGVAQFSPSYFSVAAGVVGILPGAVVAAETDPTVPTHVKNITSAQLSNWDVAYGWGNHAGLYKAASWVPSWNDVTGKPSTFTPSTHWHSEQGGKFIDGGSWNDIEASAADKFFAARVESNTTNPPVSGVYNWSLYQQGNRVRGSQIAVTAYFKNRMFFRGTNGNTVGYRPWVEVYGTDNANKPNVDWSALRFYGNTWGAFVHRYTGSDYSAIRFQDATGATTYATIGYNTNGTVRINSNEVWHAGNSNSSSHNWYSNTLVTNHISLGSYGDNKTSTQPWYGLGRIGSEVALTGYYGVTIDTGSGGQFIKHLINGSEKFKVTSGGTMTTGSSTLYGNITLIDGGQGRIIDFVRGSTSDGAYDYRIRHNWGMLQLQGNCDSHPYRDIATFNHAGGVSLYNQGDLRLQTTTSGVTTTGNHEATGYLKAGGSYYGVNSSNVFGWNGAADIILQYAGRGSGGRAIVHMPNNELRINYGGDFSGGTVIASKLTVLGTIQSSTEIEAFSSSDIRIKQYLKPFQNVLQTVGGIDVFYHERLDKTNRIDIGVSAQRIEQLWNPFVRRGADITLNNGEIVRNALAVRYDKLGAAVAIQGLKETKKWMDSRDKRIAELEREVKELKKRLNAA